MQTKKLDLGLRSLVTFRPNTSDEFVIRAILIDRKEYPMPVCKPAVIFDIGANIGAASILLANSYPDAKIYAFEPVLENFNILKENVEAYPNVEIFPFALGDKSENRIMMASDDASNLGGFSFHVEGSDVKNQQVLPVVDIKQFMITKGLTGIDLMKIDTEGCEFEIVNRLSDNLPSIIMGEGHGVNDFKMFDLLDQNNFHIGITKPYAQRTYNFIASKKDLV